MIEALQVDNLGIIDHIEIELEEGLTVITGETGAGKTLITTALGFLLGQRLPVDAIGPNKDSLRVKAILGVGDESISVERELSGNGRSRGRVNGEAVSIQELVKLVGPSVELFGQHMGLRLTRPDEQERLLDVFGECDSAQYLDAKARHEGTRRACEDLEKEIARDAKEIELADYELAEIRAAAIKGPDEDERILVELDRLSSTAKIRGLLERLHELIRSDSGPIGELAIVSKGLEGVGSELGSRLAAALQELDDIASEARKQAELAFDDPEQVSLLEQRLETLSRMKMRYGPTLSHVLERESELSKRVAQFDRRGVELASLRNQLEETGQVLRRCFGKLVECRIKAARNLEQRVGAVLSEVALDRAVFKVVVDEITAKPSFFFSANPGFVPQPLDQVASGGELARLLLVLATVIGAGSDTVVFDEVDAGIGGTTAIQVAKMLRTLAKARQVLVVSHLPQVAAAARNHLLVEKIVGDNASSVTVRRLCEDDRLPELARMLSGQPDSELARRHAFELVSLF
jgi:DNA repair protein RecN (Recombination protein N)